MSKEEERLPDDEPKHSNYDEDAFNKLVDDDDDASGDDETELSDFPEGTEESDGSPDTDSKAKPEGEDDEEKKDKDTEDSDDPDKGKEDNPDLPAWMEAIPEDQRDEAVTEFLKLHEDIEKIQARYESQSGQLKPTQRKVARLEELLKRFSGAMKPGDDLEKRGKALDDWIEKHGKDFPDEAEDLKASFDAYKETASTLADDAKKYRSTLDESSDDESVDRTLQRRLLERAENNAAQISVDPSFVAYLEQHPEHKAQASSPFAHDVLDVLDAFREDTQWQPPTRSEDFVEVNQMLVSPLFAGWSQAIGLTSGQVQSLDATGQAKVFHQFKVDLDTAHKATPEDKGGEGSDNNNDTGEAARLSEKREKQKKDFSPPARKTGTGGGKAAALKGEAYFDELEV